MNKFFVRDKLQPGDKFYKPNFSTYMTDSVRGALDCWLSERPDAFFDLYWAFDVETRDESRPGYTRTWSVASGAKNSNSERKYIIRDLGEYELTQTQQETQPPVDKKKQQIVMQREQYRKEHNVEPCKHPTEFIEPYPTGGKHCTICWKIFNGKES